MHRCELHASDVEVVDDGARVTSAERTARDAAALETVKDAGACLDALARAGTLTAPMLHRVGRSAAGRWGCRRITKVLPLVDGRAQSPPESWVRVACHLAGLPPPVPQDAVVEHGVFLGGVDLAWPEARLIVEYEGAYHFDGVQVVTDDARYAALLAAGWRVIQVLAADLRDMDALVDRIALALEPVAD